MINPKLHPHHFSLLIIFLLSSLLLCLTIDPGLAQETNFNETFDDAALPGWERSQDVTVEAGVLRIYPGNLALHPGNWEEINLQIRLRTEEPGETVIRYYFHDRSHYTLTLLDDFILLERTEDDYALNLGEAPVEDNLPGDWVDLMISVQAGNHSVTINGKPILQASDLNPLPGGSLLLQRFGEGLVEFDSISIIGLESTSQKLPQEVNSSGDDSQPGEFPPPAEPQDPFTNGPPAALQPTNQPQDTAGLIQEFFLSQASQIELDTFAINLVLAVIAAFILGRVYIHWGASLSNRRAFAANFMLMTVTTTFIIMVVRSSVALSLGLVGALSIVRFRAAVKEPEELAYLFLAIGIGIGLGDNQRLLTLVTLLIAILVLGLMRLLRSSKSDANLHLTVTSRGQNKLNLPQVMELVEKHVSKLKLLRLDENGEVLEVSFLVEFRQMDHLSQAAADLRSLAPDIEVSYLDNKGIW